MVDDHVGLAEHLQKLRNVSPMNDPIDDDENYGDDYGGTGVESERSN